MLAFLKELSLLQISLIFLVANMVIFVVSVTSCWLLGVMYSEKRIFSRWEPLKKGELFIAGVAVILNSVVSILGWMIWKAGYIDIQVASIGRSFTDCIIMLLVMDFGMYVFHRIAHSQWMYRTIHAFHHRHEATNPISLFVLHPIEVGGFGGLMLSFLIIYPMSFLGLIAYLTLNIVFGTLGHSGVEPFPAWIRNVPVLRYLGTSTFHAEHHENHHYNFGFYTLLWDKLFGTLDPDYDNRFTQKGKNHNQ